MWKAKIQTLPALFLVANSISWFSLTLVVIGQLASGPSLIDTLLIAGTYFGSLIASAIVGATLLYKKFREKATLLLWTLVGVVTCLLFSVLTPEASLSILVILSFVLGGSIGLGIPSCLSFFANHTKTETRGRSGALMFFSIQLLTAMIYIPITGVGVDYQFIVLAIWRLLGVISIFYFKPSAKQEDDKTSLFTIIRERKFMLYFIPWFMFTLVNFIEKPLLEQFFGPGLFGNYELATTIIASVSAFLGGMFCDLKGRKVAGILGFVLLGIGYAILSLLPEAQLSQILYVVFDGTAWGILYVTFIFIVWGDISENKIPEKYYLLGGMPFLFAGLIEAIVQPFVTVVPISTSFSLASFFLFLAVLPLLYAPETLPEKTMKDRELKNYIEKAQKEAEKAQKTEDEDTPIENGDDGVEFEGSEFEEKLKEAEKYY
jgi:MFS family permease